MESGVDAQTIDEVIVGILLTSGRGRQWLENAAQKGVMERRLLDLQRRGLDRRAVADMWRSGDAGLVGSLDGATDAQIESVNRTWAAQAS